MRNLSVLFVIAIIVDACAFGEYEEIGEGGTGTTGTIQLASVNLTINGTSGDDTIVIGRGYNGGSFQYIVCINRTWMYPLNAYVTGASDIITVYGLGGDDTIIVRDVNDYYTCGAQSMWLYRMDYSYACPADENIKIHGDEDDDVLLGGQCGEWLDGDNGIDTIFGGAGSDDLFGGDGNDCLSDSTVHTVHCGYGSDSENTPGNGYMCEYHEITCLY